MIMMCLCLASFCLCIMVVLVVFIVGMCVYDPGVVVFVC